jgi:PAS domain-containing protein
MGLDPMLAVWLIGTAVAAAVFGVLLLAAFPGTAPAAAPGAFADNPARTEFLFDGEALIDATPSARALLPHSPMRSGTPWEQLMAWLQPRFPGHAEALARLPTEGRVALTGDPQAADCLLLDAELRGGITRIRIHDGADGAGDVDPLAARATQEELQTLRATVAEAPLPVWRESAAGDVVWANAAYLDLATRRRGAEAPLGWPLPRLFERQAMAQGAPHQRQKVETAAGERWFDITGVADGPGRLLYALPADAAVQAEASLRGFMQTLTKTFAHLPTGLAIFDQARRLALFNPALVDLTGLPPEMLSARPTLTAFFDALRERAMLPEPRDYRSWRRQMTELEDAASSGLYEETWSLPGGQTYRVSGRPHPNGALALMFEDISTEITETRRYRADLELGQAVIDAMDEAIAVFSAAGVLVMTNTAYTALWGHDPVATLDGEASIAAVAAHWRAGSAPTAAWDRTEDFVAAIGARDVWSDEVRLADGRLVLCRCARLAGGATLVGFRPHVAPRAEARPRGAARQSAG